MPGKKIIKVAVVDYEAGNLFSVQHACKTVGLSPVITDKPEVIRQADALILPGVGAFGAAMKNLAKLDLVEPLKEFAASGKPFMGICLGMQILFSRSEEFGDHEGLNLIPGNVVRFPSISGNGSRIKVPQIGWNRLCCPIEMETGWNATPLKQIVNGEFMYFVHSYYVRPVNSENVLAITEYAGLKYCSAVLKENIFATQFHPEKSATEGIRIYQNWANGLRNREN